MKPEFGNLEQIRMLQREKENEVRFEEVREKCMVGTQEIEACGYCGAPTREFAEWIKVLDGAMRICHECNSIIELR